MAVAKFKDMISQVFLMCIWLRIKAVTNAYPYSQAWIKVEHENLIPPVGQHRHISPAQSAVTNAPSSAHRFQLPLNFHNLKIVETILRSKFR